MAMQPGRARRKRIWPVVLIGLILLLPGWWFFSWLLFMLQQPVPNAREIFTRAGEQVVVSLPSSGLTTTDIYTMSLHGTVPGVGMLPNRRGEPGTTPSPSLAEMQALMAANQPALDTLRQGLHAEYCEKYSSPLGNTLFPHFAKINTLERVLAADAYTRSCAGDWAGAMTSCLDGLQVGEMVPHKGIRLSLLVGVAGQATVRRQAWQIVPHLSAGEASAAVHRLEAIMTQRVTSDEVMNRELGVLRGFTSASAEMSFRFTEEYAAAQNALLLATLALQAYQADHHAYPPALSMLSTAYRTALSTDPLNPVSPFHYRLTTQGYLLYSIGPDHKDDGGTPSTDGLRTPMDDDRATACKLTSTGDIVAGVNVR